MFSFVTGHSVPTSVPGSLYFTRTRQAKEREPGIEVAFPHVFPSAFPECIRLAFLMLPLVSPVYFAVESVRFLLVYYTVRSLCVPFSSINHQELLPFDLNMVHCSSFNKR